MLKKITVLAFAGMLCLPAAVVAGGNTDDMSRKINDLSRQLEQLKRQMVDMQESQEEHVAEIEEKAEGWDLASRFQLSGDFRTRADYVTADAPSHYQALNVARGIDWFTHPDAMSRDSWNNHIRSVNSMGTTAELLRGFGLSEPELEAQLGSMFYGDPTAVDIIFDATGRAAMTKKITDPDQLLSQSQRTQNLVDFMKTFTPAQRAALFASMGYRPDPKTRYDNDTIWTNRLRLNMQVQATENVEFKGRLAMYKAWGMQNNPVDYTFNAGHGGGPFMLNSLAFDGSASRQPTDSVLRVDRAFINWTNIGGQPIWFSIGRRPTTDGPPAQLRLGTDQRMGTPTSVMDYAFDGLTIGYAYQSLPGLPDFPGRIRFCYGRGFEAGPTAGGGGLNDVDFAGISWDIYRKGNRFVTLQSFAAFDMFNVPDNVNFVNPIEFAVWENDNTLFNPLDPAQNLILDRVNLGNIYHTSAVYMDKHKNLNFFILGAWSRTDARGVDELGTSLLGSWWDTPQDRDGYSIYVGVRYDLPDHNLKFGFEYNHGTKYWISFTPGNDDLYASKLATRGNVYEIYGIWNIPAGEAISQFGGAFIRFGFKHYQYNYTGSGFWLGAPVSIDDLANDPLNAQFYTPVESMNQVYVTLEVYF